MSKNAYFKKALEIEGDMPKSEYLERLPHRGSIIWVVSKLIYALLAIARAIETQTATIAERR